MPPPRTISHLSGISVRKVSSLLASARRKLHTDMLGADAPAAHPCASDAAPADNHGGRIVQLG